MIFNFFRKDTQVYYKFIIKSLLSHVNLEKMSCVPFMQAKFGEPALSKTVHEWLEQYKFNNLFVK